MQTALLLILAAGLAACAQAPAAAAVVAAPQSNIEPSATQPEATATATPAPTVAPQPTVTRETSQEYSTVDRPDDVDGYQIHFVYALPSDGADDFLDLTGEIELSANAMNSWLEGKTGRRLRYDTFDGALDISYLRLPYTADQISDIGTDISDLLEHWLKNNGFRSDHKLYVVHYDGFFVTPEGYCGLAPSPPQALGQTAVLLLRAYNPTYDLNCPRNFTKSHDFTGFFEMTILHELLHMLGMVPECGQSEEGRHVTDNPQDLMYFQYDGSYSPVYTYLDYKNNDYYNHGDPTCPDLARSIFLEPLPEGAEPPPLWETSVGNTPPNPLR
jgi:hypothetical protein